MRNALAAAVLMAAAMSGGEASAQSATYDFTYTLPGFDSSTYVTASGTITTSGPMVDGGYQITGITGTRDFVIEGSDNIQAITGLLQPDTAYSADDLLFLNGGAYFDEYGITFTLAGGYGGDDFAGDVNLSYYNGYVEPLEGTSAGVFTLTPVDLPEPGSVALVAAGLVGLFAARRRIAGSGVRQG
jgi:hypothetical protein